MNQTYLYIGGFLDPKALAQAVSPVTEGHLSCPISAPHITFAYRPEEVDESLFGQVLQLTAIGYGRDEENEGLLVTVETGSDQLRDMLARIEVPHITLSVSEDGQPVNTRYLDFRPIAPIPLIAVFGGYTKEHRVVTRPL